MADIVDLMADQAIPLNIQTFREFVRLVGSSNLTLHTHALSFIIYASKVKYRTKLLDSEVQRLFKLNSKIKDKHCV